MDSLHALGSNGSGQLGIGHTDDVSVPTPVLEISNRKVVSLAAGGNHTVLLFDDRSVRTFGNNDEGNCFMADKEKYTGVQHVAATWSATLVVHTSGRISVCGSGNAGELGLGEGTRSAEQVKLIEHFPPEGTTIVKMAACMAHVVVVLSNGEVWGWGQGKRGQLGQPSEIVWAPRRVTEIGFFAVDAVCGKEFTVVVGSPSTGELAVLGLHTRDRFGIRAGAPKSIRDWKQTTASWGSVYFLMDSGELISWGRDDRGQLAPSNIPPLKDVAAGSEHCLGIDNAGNVLAWGWGEHGNCGQSIDPDGNVRNGWNEIQVPHGALAVFAGCATSFIVTGR